MPARLVGRDHEVEALRRVVREAAAESRVRCVALEAPAGMGAGALAEVAAREGEAVGASVLRARADALHRDTLGGTAVASGWIAPGGAADDVMNLVASLAEKGPVVIVVEHVHVADPVTIAGIQQVVASLADCPVAVVATTRDATMLPGAALVDDMVEAGCDHLVLGPLSESESVELAERELGAACGPVLRRAVVRAGGVPLVVLELVAGLRREGRIAVEQGVAEIGSHDLPVSVRESVLRYLEDLPRATIDVLEVAAAMGPVIDLADLALVLGRSVSDVLHDLAPADIYRLLEHAGPVAWFRHELLRDALHAAPVPAVRMAMHGEIAAAFAAAGKDAPQVARHVLAAGGLAPAAVAADAAWTLRRDAPALALEVCRVTLDAGVADPAVHDRLVAARAWPMVAAGRLAEAEASAREVLARPHDPGVDVELTWCLVAALQRQGQAVAGRAELVRLLDRADLDPDERRWLLGRLPIAHVLTGDVGAAEACAETLLADPDLRDDPEVAIGARVPRIFGCVARGEVATAVTIADEVEALSRDHPVTREGIGIVPRPRSSKPTGSTRPGRRCAPRRGTTPAAVTRRWSASTTCGSW
jgi:hypothetical protein